MEYDENGCLPVQSPSSLGKGRERIQEFEEAVQSPMGYLRLLEVVMTVMEQQIGVPVRSENEVEGCGIRVRSAAEVEGCEVRV